MADKKGGKKGAAEGPKEPESPWLKGVSGVTGVIPPGRRLSPVTEKRPTRWSASGVRGVRPPGTQKPGQGPSAESAAAWEKKKSLREKQNQQLYEGAKSGRAVKKRGGELSYDPGRPVGGYTPDPFAGQRDPKDLKGFLEEISELIRRLSLGTEYAVPMAELVRQSHAPFEVIVGFTVLSALVGKDNSLRRRHTLPLERGAKAFFNLSRRLDPNVKPPRGLVPESVDAIFYDLPTTAFQLPFAYAVEAFGRMIDLLRSEEAQDRKLIEGVRALRKKYIDGRALGDRALEKLFPWTEPEWAPEEE